MQTIIEFFVAIVFLYLLSVAFVFLLCLIDQEFQAFRKIFKIMLWYFYIDVIFDD